MLTPKENRSSSLQLFPPQPFVFSLPRSTTPAPFILGAFSLYLLLFNFTLNTNRQKYMHYSRQVSPGLWTTQWWKSAQHFFVFIRNAFSNRMEFAFFYTYSPSAINCQSQDLLLHRQADEQPAHSRNSPASHTKLRISSHFSTVTFNTFQFFSHFQSFSIWQCLPQSVLNKIY